jgi:hypothetical protein
MDLHYVALRWLLFAVVFVGLPGVLMMAPSLIQLDALGFALRRPLTALALGAVWFVACGQGIVRIADGLAITMVANVASVDVASKVHAKNREWSTETGWGDFAGRCEHDLQANGANADWCVDRVLPYVEDRVGEADYRDAVERWDARGAFDGVQLPPDLAAIVSERVRADRSSLSI